MIPKQLVVAFPRPQHVYSRDESSGSRLNRGRPNRILIVEDDFLVAAEAEAALRDAGFEIVGAVASGEEALACVNCSEPPSLVIMDIRLAGDRDGIDVAIELFRDHAIPCVFASAHSDAEARIRADPAKPLGWLAKPYSMPSLVALVRRAMAQMESDG